MKKLIAIVTAALFSIGTSAFADSDDDKNAIEVAVFDYFHGQGEGSRERLFRAFEADHATMVGVVRNDAGEESVRSWKDMNQVLTNWSAKQNPDGGNRDGEIISMNMVDDRLAVVLFRSTDRFYDALTLSKLDGNWKIIAKAFVLQ